MSMQLMMIIDHIALQHIAFNIQCININNSKYTNDIQYL